MCVVHGSLQWSQIQQTVPYYCATLYLWWVSLCLKVLHRHNSDEILSFLFYYLTKKKKMLLRTDLHGINIVLSQFWDIQSVLTNTLKPSHGVTTIYFAICHVRENCCKGHKMICLFIIPQVWLHVPLLRVCLHVQEECWLRSRSGALLAPQQEGSHVDVKKHSI